MTSPRGWYRIENTATPGRALVRIYDGIGGFFGVQADEFTRELDALDVSSIDLHVNSPGGDVFDGLAIMNSLRRHPAKVTAYVDGMAASAASFIVVGGADEVVVGLGAEMMIHNPRAMTMGGAETHRDSADRLDKIRDNLAGVYMSKAGGSVEEWRAAMLAETWYTAEEAVNIGLADRVEVPAEDVSAAKAQFNLSVFNYAGRSEAPAPTIVGCHCGPNGAPAAIGCEHRDECPHKPPAASAGGSTPPTEGGSAVAFSDEQITDMRRQLGLPEDADEATILAALTESLAERADTPTPQPASVATAVTPAAPESTPTPQATAPGTMVIDSSAWQEREERIKRLEAADQKRRRDERDEVINKAVREGKFPRARVEAYARLWDADAEGTRAVIASLTPNVVPVNELGHADMDDDALDAEFSHLFPKGA